MNIAHPTPTSAPQGAIASPPVGGHVIVSFGRQWQADEAMRALVELGFGREIVHHVDDPALIAAIAQDLTSQGLNNASWLAQVQCDFAERGHCWLVLRTQSDGRAFQISDCVTSCGATSVQYYGNLVVEELLPQAQPPGRTATEAKRRRTPQGERSAPASER